MWWQQSIDPYFLRFVIADQVYALYQGFQFDNGAKLHFGVYQNNQQHEAEGMLLKVTRLPQYVNNSTVYNLFRRYGPLALCKLVLEQDESVFLGTALVQYFYHEDSETAIQEMVSVIDSGSTPYHYALLLAWPTGAWKQNVRRNTKYRVQKSVGAYVVGRGETKGV